jgi:hypothetical protein
MKRYTYYLLLVLSVALSTCKKGFLDTKPDKALLVPTTISDMQALLDNIAVFNLTPSITANADGDFYTTDAAFKTWALDAERNSYTWSADIWESFDPPDWQIPYRQVFYSNVVLEGLSPIAPSAPGYNAIKGTALFSRAYAYYNLLQTFALPYRSASAATDPGMSIRLVSDVTQHPPRSSVQATYDRVVSDLQAARNLLPVTGPYKTRPNLAADFALLARVFLMEGNYVLAGKYADSSLRQSGALIDYNTLSPAATRPFPRSIPAGNDEVLYYASQGSYTFISNTSTLADTLLFRSYAANDLRRSLFYKASGISGTFKGNYTGIIVLFSGIATDEMYLLRAECSARQGLTATAMADLNTLLVKRWKTGTYVPMVAPDANTALALILTERRKELIGRNMRWTDLGRLNADTRFALTLTHKINGVVYTLAPDSKRYAYPLPADEITLSGALQNVR